MEKESIHKEYERGKKLSGNKSDDSDSDQSISNSPRWSSPFPKSPSPKRCGCAMRKPSPKTATGTSPTGSMRNAKVPSHHISLHDLDDYDGDRELSKAHLSYHLDKHGELEQKASGPVFSS